MAKAKKKSAKEASNIFHNIMQASVKGNPKPAPKKKAEKNEGWLKINSIDQLEKLKKNDLIVRYQAKGQLKEEINLGNKENYRMYKVAAVKKLAKELELNDVDFPNITPAANNLVISHPLRKKFEAIINEQIWWYQP